MANDDYAQLCFWFRISSPGPQFCVTVLSTSRISSACRLQVLPGFDLHFIKGEFEQIRAQTLMHNDLPSGAVGPTVPTRLPGRDLVQADDPVGNVAVLTKKGPVSVLNSRTLKGAACADADTSISVSSTVFPEMEGRLIMYQNGGRQSYSTWNTILSASELGENHVSI